MPIWLVTCSEIPLLIILELKNIDILKNLKRRQLDEISDLNSHRPAVSEITAWGSFVSEQRFNRIREQITLFLNLANTPRTKMQNIQMLTMGSRPSPATWFRAWGLRHTLRRSSPRSHLCSRWSLSIDPHTPTIYRTILEQDQTTTHTSLIMYPCMSNFQFRTAATHVPSCLSQQWRRGLMKNCCHEQRCLHTGGAACGR